MSLTRKRWFILALACFVNLFVGSIYTWSVFATPLAQQIGAATGASLTAGDLAIAFSLANGVGPIPMILGGWITDRFGPRFVMITGGLMMGAGFLIAGPAESLAQLLVGYGLLFGLGLGLVYGCTVNNTMKFFPDHRGLAGGLTTTFYGLSSAVIAPVATLLIKDFGVAHAMEMLGWAFGIVIVAGGLLSATCPDGFLPEGYTPPKTGLNAAGRDADWLQMLKSPLFWPMLGLLLCGAVSGMMIASNAFTLGHSAMGLTAAAAASGVSFFAFSNTGGRLLAGVASDYLGRTGALALGLASAILGMGCLAFASHDAIVLFYVGLAAVGLSFGAFMGVFPGFTAQEFGTRHNSVNYALMFTGFALAGVAGPSLMNCLHESGLAVACLTGAAIAAAGFVFILLYRRVKLAR